MKARAGKTFESAADGARRGASALAEKAPVANDSSVMRAILSAALARDPEVDVTAAMGRAGAARMAACDLVPGVITLDVELPGTSGRGVLKPVMARQAARDDIAPTALALAAGSRG